jgi:hypothetical protein
VVQQAGWDSAGSLWVTVGGPGAGGLPGQDPQHTSSPAAAAAAAAGGKGGPEPIPCTNQQQQQHHHQQQRQAQQQQQVVTVGPTLQELELHAAANGDAAQRLAPAAPGPWRRHPELLAARGALGGGCHVTLEVVCQQVSGKFIVNTLVDISPKTQMNTVKNDSEISVHPPGGGGLGGGCHVTLEVVCQQVSMSQGWCVGVR